MHSCVSEQPQGGRPHMHFSLPQGIFSELEGAGGVERRVLHMWQLVGHACSTVMPFLQIRVVMKMPRLQPSTRV